MAKKSSTNKPKQRIRTALKVIYEKVPVVITSEAMFSKHSQEEPWGMVIAAKAAYPIKGALKSSEQPKFHWTGDSWVCVVRTKKTYDLAYDVIAKACIHEAIRIDDQRDAWISCSGRMLVDICEDPNGQYVRLYGAYTYKNRETIKQHDGKYCADTKCWEASPTVLDDLMDAMLEEGVPLYGNFNYDGAHSDSLAKRGYKKVKAPSSLVMDDDAEYWAYA